MTIAERIADVQAVAKKCAARVRKFPSVKAYRNRLAAADRLLKVLHEVARLPKLVP